MDPSKADVYDTVVFEGPPMTEQTLWPRHCVQESWGAELHKELKVRAKCIYNYVCRMSTLLIDDR